MAKLWFGLWKKGEVNLVFLAKNMASLEQKDLSALLDILEKTGLR